MANTEKKITIQWSGKLSYVLGIIAADGYVSKDGRHISITSKDKEVLESCKVGLEIDNQITTKSRIKGGEKKYFVLQFGSIKFVEFLVSIGITNAKSKTLSDINVPNKYYLDFLRGCIDGDGNISIYTHPESKKDQLKLRITTASPNFLLFLKRKNSEILNITGGWIYSPTKRSIQELTYGKSDTIKILNFVYNTDCKLRLSRKFSYVSHFLSKNA